MKKAMIMLAAVLLTACTKTDLFDEGQKEKDIKSSYAENFAKAYPNVDLNQSWDYSHKNPAYSLPTSGHATTRAASISLVAEKDPYEVDFNTSQWLMNNIGDSKDHRKLGSAFYMKTPNCDFSIVPIFQGKAAMKWELHAVIDGVDYKIWNKSQDIWVSEKGKNEWKEVEKRSNKELEKNTEGNVDIKAIPYTFKNVPEGLDMYFYLFVTSTDSGHDNLLYSQQSSLNGQMLSLKNEEMQPNNLPDGYQASIIACEDLPNGDWDCNDVVFMVYGKPEVPFTQEIKDGDPITKKTTVRYMIEDLGATDDFDFNDIVVDVIEETLSTPKYDKNKAITWTDAEPTQKAIIRHLGGTLPFQLTIGDTELEEMQGKLGSNPNKEFAVTGWNKNTHNISVRVKQAQNSTVYNNVAFPKAGEAPMIVAKDPQVEWMPERQHVPETWFYIPTDE